MSLIAFFLILCLYHLQKNPWHNTVANTKYWLKIFGFDLGFLWVMGFFWWCGLVFFLMVPKLKRYMLAFWTASQGHVKTLDMRNPSSSSSLGVSSRQENLEKIFWSTKVNWAVEFHQPVESGHYFPLGNTVHLYSELFQFL